MGYFAISMNNTPSELIDTIKANLELYKLANKDNEYNYLLDMIQGDLEKLHINKDYNMTINDLLIRNKCQENSDRHNEFIKQNMKNLKNLLPNESLTEDEKNELLSDIDTPFSYLTDEEIIECMSQIQGEHTGFNIDNFVKEATNIALSEEIESPKLCYSLTELQDPKIFQESLDTLNNLDVNVFTGEVKLENKERK